VQLWPHGAIDFVFNATLQLGWDLWLSAVHFPAPADQVVFTPGTTGNNPRRFDVAAPSAFRFATCGPSAAPADLARAGGADGGAAVLTWCLAEPLGLVPLESWNARTQVAVSFNCKELNATAPLLVVSDVARRCQNFTLAVVDGAWLNFTVRNTSQRLQNGSYTARLFAGSVTCLVTGELSAHTHSWSFVLVEAANTTVTARSPTGRVSDCGGAGCALCRPKRLASAQVQLAGATSVAVGFTFSRAVVCTGGFAVAIQDESTRGIVANGSFTCAALNASSQVRSHLHTCERSADARSAECVGDSAVVSGPRPSGGHKIRRISPGRLRRRAGRKPTVLRLQRCGDRPHVHRRAVEVCR
jgi:hypothetical protein